jgi:CRISPR-associated protein Cas5t
VHGLLNSFRIPDFQTYHKTLPFPPKTTVCGMIGAALDWSPEEVNDKIIPELDVAININQIDGPVRDLWKIQKIIKKSDPEKPNAVIIDNHTYYGAVMMRELLYQPHYTIYLKSRNDQFMDLIFKKLQDPEWALSLGHDDELILLKEIIWVEIEPKKLYQFTNIVLPINISGKYKLDTDSIQSTEKPLILSPPLIYNIPVRFVYKDNERKAIEFQTFSVISNIKILMHEPIDGYREGNNEIVFF